MAPCKAAPTPQSPSLGVPVEEKSRSTWEEEVGTIKIEPRFSRIEQSPKILEWDAPSSNSCALRIRRYA